MNNVTTNEQTLTIVIPALDEEDAIGQTITRCLAAREEIKREGGLDAIEIIVVSDGSTDRTAEIAQGFDEVKVIVFEKNRGYGAAIKEGWRQGKGTLLAFLDADGTCDPLYFGPFCRAAQEESADVVLGSRMGPQSKMPRIRRLGNHIYALLLGFLCGRAVTDIASGMRVVRRSALRHLYPLPDGLHFTPSMSTRALLNDLRVIEIPMRYEERIGRSKLSVVRDGVRFLQTIFAGILCYQPERLLLLASAFSLLLLLVLAAHPIEFYLAQRCVEEWMVYRFVACFLLGWFALLLLLSTALINRIASFGPRRSQANKFWPSLIGSLFRGRNLAVFASLLTCLAVFFVWPGIIEYATTRHVNMHWSRLLAGAFCFSSAIQTAVFAVLQQVVEVWRREGADSAEAAPLIGPASKD